jgi:tol-pal system protein YbgF
LSRIQRRAAIAARFLLLWSVEGKTMVIRSLSSPDFRFSQIRQGQRWLPLVTFMLLVFDAAAAVDDQVPFPVSRRPLQIVQAQTRTISLDNARIAMQPESNSSQSSDDGLDEARRQIENAFTARRAGQGDPAEDYRRLQDRFSLMLAQVRTVGEEQSETGQKMAQADTTANNRGVVQLLNQVEALNGELSRLRGQMEVLSNDISNAQKRQRDMYIDLDTRLRRIEQGGGTKKEQDVLSALDERIRKLEQASATPNAMPPPAASATVAPPVTPPPEAATPAASTAAASLPATTSATASVAVTAAPNSLPPASLSTTDQAAIQRAYDNAYSNYRLSDFPNAIRGFESFLKSYPKHALAPNAQYWIGESYFHLHQYREAIDAQRRLLGTYPESAKSADSLLIIGTSESFLGDTLAARKTFEELIAKYPASESAEKAKSRLAKLK